MNLAPLDSSCRRPRAVRPTLAWWMQRALSGLLVMLFVFLCYWQYVHRVMPVRALALRGVVTRGEVLNLTAYSSAAHYFVTYSFEDSAGTTHVAQDGVKRSRFKALHTGESVTVTYLPEAPAVSRCAEVDRSLVSSAYINLLGLIVIAGLGLGHLTVCLERDARLHWFLARYGDMVIGATAGRRAHIAPFSLGFTIEYEFVDRLGEQQYGVATALLLAYLRIRRSKELAILYAPEQPRRSLPYEVLRVKIVAQAENAGVGS